MKAKATDPAQSAPGPRLVELGKIVKPHGLKGAVKALIWSGSDENLNLGSMLFVFLEDGTRRELTLRQVAPLGNCFQLQFDGVDSPEKAERLRNGTLFIDREDLSEGLYLHDLKGKEVFLESGESRGVIKDFWINPAGHTYGILGEDRYVALFLPEVELMDDGRVIVPPRAIIEAPGEDE